MSITPCVKSSSLSYRCLRRAVGASAETFDANSSPLSKTRLIVYYVRITSPTSGRNSRRLPLDLCYRAKGCSCNWNSCGSSTASACPSSSSSPNSNNPPSEGKRP